MHYVITRITAAAAAAAATYSADEANLHCATTAPGGAFCTVSQKMSPVYNLNQTETSNQLLTYNVPIIVASKSIYNSASKSEFPNKGWNERAKAERRLLKLKTPVRGAANHELRVRRRQ